MGLSEDLSSTNSATRVSGQSSFVLFTFGVPQVKFHVTSVTQALLIRYVHLFYILLSLSLSALISA